MAVLDAGLAVLACVRPVNGDGEFSGWRRLGPCRAGLCSWRSSSTFARRVQRGLVEMAEREDERPSPGRLAGFARMANPADRVRVALALEDGVGLLGRAKATMMTRWAALKRKR